MPPSRGSGVRGRSFSTSSTKRWPTSSTPSQRRSRTQSASAARRKRSSRWPATPTPERPKNAGASARPSVLPSGNSRRSSPNLKTARKCRYGAQPSCQLGRCSTNSPGVRGQLWTDAEKERGRYARCPGRSCIARFGLGRSKSFQGGGRDSGFLRHEQSLSRLRFEGERRSDGSYRSQETRNRFNVVPSPASPIQFLVWYRDLFLTDGLHWEHFTDFKLGDLSPSNTLNIGSDDLGQVAAYLVQELDAALISPEEEQLNVLAEQVEQIQEEVTKLRSLEHRIRQLENADTNKSRASSPSGEVSPESVSSLWRPLSSLSNVKGTKPSAFRLPNSQEIPVKTWGQVLFE